MDIYEEGGCPVIEQQRERLEVLELDNSETTALATYLLNPSEEAPFRVGDMNAWVEGEFIAVQKVGGYLPPTRIVLDGWAARCVGAWLARRFGVP
jgi:hypothetical protein